MTQMTLIFNEKRGNFMIKREQYLNELISARENKLIKVMVQ